ncbi:MAG: hypothetical protein PHF57_11180 [Methanoregula sp.]|jgi:hypothetical protein|nr:hypothetical protein [Methanoregula sp.]
MRVKLKNIDNSDQSSKFFYRARRVEITPTSKAIETPYRILNNSDLTAKAHTPSDIPLISPLAGMHLEINTNETEKLFTSNEYTNKLATKIEILKQQMQHSSIIFPFIQPSQTAIKAHLIDDDLKIRALRMILKVQGQAKLPLLGVPWLNYSPNLFRSVCNDLLNNSEQEFIFYLKADEKPAIIEEISDIILDHIATDRLNFIGIIHSRKALVSYDILWEKFRQTNAAIVMSNVDRYDIHNSNLSSSHLDQCILGDLFIPKVRRGGGASDNIDVFKRLRVFNHNDLTVNPIIEFDGNNWINLIGEELNDNRVSLKLTHYQEAVNNQVKFNILNYISKVHEYLSSTKEFVNTHPYLKDEDMKSYIESKDVLRSALQNLPGH